MKKLLLLCLVLSGCTASFQPFPNYSKAEIEQFFRNSDSNFALLDKKISVISESMAKESKK